MVTQSLLTELEIKSLLVQERYYRDTAQWENLRKVYHPNASKTSIKISWFDGDIDGFVSGSVRMAKGGTGAVHSLCPVEVHLNGDKALTESTGSIQVRFDHDCNEYDCISHTRFISCLEKVNGAWKMLSLECIYDRDVIHPVVPLEKPVALPVDHERGRPSYKCLGWVLSRKQFAVKQDLPGTDLPESVAALMRERFVWLCG